MNIYLFRKLLAFILSTLTYLSAFFLTRANAQIVYTDVNPDKTFITNNASYVLDLNNDGVDDFRFSISMLTEPFSQNALSILPLSGSEYADISGAGANFPLPLQINQVINPGLSWEIEGHTVIYAEKPGSQWQTYGAWFGGPYFIGLRIHTSSQTFYGWVQLKATADLSGASFTIYDYAYNSSFNQPISAGQKCPPQAAITANGPTTFCTGGSVVLSANSGIGFFYQWKLNGVNIIGATGKNYTATTAGKYKVKVQDNVNGCAKISPVVLVTVPCIGNRNADDDPEMKQLTIYPNPASDQLTIQLPTIEEATVQIINLVGATIFTGKINNGVETIDVSSFAKGLYLIAINTSTQKYFSKFQKQ